MSAYWWGVASVGIAVAALYVLRFLLAAIIIAFDRSRWFVEFGGEDDAVTLKQRTLRRVGRLPVWSGRFESPQLGWGSRWITVWRVSIGRTHPIGGDTDG